MNEWMNHPDLKNMDPVQAGTYQTCLQTDSRKNGRSLAPVMMALITSANKKGISFTPQEMSLILDILKEGKSPEEQSQIDQMVHMVRSHMKSNVKKEGF